MRGGRRGWRCRRTFSIGEKEGVEGGRGRGRWERWRAERGRARWECWEVKETDWAEV